MAEAPQSVAIFDIDAMRADFAVMQEGIDRVGIRHLSRPGFDGPLVQVPMSPRNRREPITLDDIAALQRK